MVVREKTRTTAKRLTLREAIDAFLLDCRARRLRAGTLHFYRTKLPRFAAWCEERGCVAVGEVEPDLLRAFLVWLDESGHSAGGQHAYARALRAWFNFLVEDGVLEESPMRRVRMPRVPKSAPIGLSVDEVEAMLEAADTLRDKAMILFLVDTGARLSEFAALNVGDVDMTSGAVVIRSGKGGKRRTVYLGRRALRALRRYLRDREDAVTPASPLWVSFRYYAEGDRLTASGVRLMLRRVGKRAGVERHNTHAFRRTFAIWSLRAGMNIYALKELMGHADIATLRHYLALVESDLQEAHREHGPVDSFL